MSSRLLPAIALVISVAIFFAYIKPVWTGPIAKTKEEIINNDEALAAANEYKEREDQLTNERNAISQENRDRLGKFLPDSVDNVGLILNINALAARSGILLSNVDVVTNTPTSAGSTEQAGSLPTARTKTSPTGSVDLSLSAAGSYAALQAFLEGVEKSARLLDARDIAITSSETGVYTYKMTIRLYWLR
jgi:Tfp pilus assembly protein PilO